MTIASDGEVRGGVQKEDRQWEMRNARRGQSTRVKSKETEKGSGSGGVAGGPMNGSSH